MKKLFLLIAMVPFLCGFDYQRFPDLSYVSPVITVYDLERNIFWEIYDTDKDDIGDVALGYEPIDASPVMVVTPIGTELVWEVDIEGVSASYYWMDLDGNGLPFSGGNYNYAEILHDPMGDGLNGNEENHSIISTEKVSI